MEASTAHPIAAIRAEFPLLARRVHERPLVYLDSAASSPRARAVIEAVARHEREHHANVHRGVHTLSQESTAAYEQARDRLARWIGAAESSEVIFTSGTTAAINLAAAAWGQANLGAGDVILVSELEHHSNIVPWQLIAERTGAAVTPIPIDDSGTLDLDALDRLLAGQVRMVTVTHASNVLGVVNPIATICERAHAAGALVLVDGAQAVQHGPVDVGALGCDFYAFGGHKMFAPTGIGALWARRSILEAMPPWQGGGEMINRVSFSGTTYADPPMRFEAGTPNIAGAIGLGAAVEWMETIDWPAAAAHERALHERLETALGGLSGVTLYGRGAGRLPVVPFNIDGVHAHDVGTILDHEGVAVRTGHHCAQPLMDRLGVNSTVRASLALFSEESEVDALVRGVMRVQEVFG